MVTFQVHSDPLRTCESRLFLCRIAFLPFLQHLNQSPLKCVTWKDCLFVLSPTHSPHYLHFLPLLHYHNTTTIMSIIIFINHYRGVFEFRQGLARKCLNDMDKIRQSNFHTNYMPPRCIIRLSSKEEKKQSRKT